MNWGRIIVCIWLGCWFSVGSVGALQGNNSVSGFVTTGNGDPIQGVLVIGSNTGLWGGVTTEADGSFHLSPAGKVISFRHVGYKPVLVRVSSSADPMRVRLEPADDTVRRLEPCASMPNNGKEWVGSGLRIKPPKKAEGPVFGDHDSHWYVRNGKDRLHIVDGYAWHNGLPLEETLVQSENITLRSWTFGENVVLDLSGRTRVGKNWALGRASNR
jgi:hypothetical protein